LIDPTDFLTNAQQKAREERWIDAADLCERITNQKTSSGDPRRAASFLEFSALCQFRGAFQCRDRALFEKFIVRAKESYEKASALFDASGQVDESKRCQSRASFAEFWLQVDSSRRSQLAKSSSELLMQLEMLSVRGSENAQTFLDFLEIFRESCNLATDFVSLKHDFERALRIGKIAIKELEHSDNDKILTVALNFMVWLLAVEAQIILPPEEFQAFSAEVRGYEEMLKAAVLKVDTPHSLCLAKESSGHYLFDVVGDPRRAVSEYQSSLVEAIKLGNVLMVGRLEWLLSQVLYWMGFSETDSDHARVSLQKALELASQAILNLQIPLQTSELAASYAVFSKCHIELAKLETDVVKRRERLKTAIEAASKGSTYESGTWAWIQAAHAKSVALYFLSRLEAPKERLELLREALRIRSETVQVTDRLLPEFWTSVVMLHDLALIQSELAILGQGPETGKLLLSEAMSTMESCLSRGEHWATNPDFTYRLAQYSEIYGNVLLQCYSSTRDPALAVKAVKQYQAAIARFEESQHELAIAPVKWKIARTNDRLGNYQEAITKFKEAAEYYREAATELPASASTFEELARYMSSWAIIENARLHHSREEYLQAAENYTEAARTLQETKTWNYLSNFCTARSLLEKGEAMSHLEKHSGAIESFSTASSMFGEGRLSVEERLKQNIPVNEIDELRYWIGVAEERERYCRGRAQLEEAKNLDKAGDKANSSRRYVSASETFTELAGRTNDSREQAELETLAKFCQALAWMKDGESKVSPELYAKAAELFLQVKEAASGDKFRLLALADGNICRSMEAGTRFRLTRNQLLYAEIKNHLGTAADYYQEAGFKKAAGWTRGYQRLFDSLFSLAAAESEMDRRKKTEQYDLAEKHLVSAAKLFGEAGFPAKKLEALEHLEHAREAKEILISSIIGLGEMPTASGAVLTPVSLAGAQALGIERFEEANVVGNLSVSEREPSPGSQVSIELELTNVGRTSATLIRLENLVPDGLELEKEKNSYRLENGSLDLGGRRLDYLKTFKVKIILKATKSGVFELRPRVSFADEMGNYRFYENWKETIMVQEARAVGERPKALERIPGDTVLSSEFRFDTERARRIFEYLVKEFLEDYMRKRLYVEKAGWRSLMDLTRGLKLPRSAVYTSRGGKGAALSELERRGLIEVRIFPEERGRGGQITRVRVAYENSIVKAVVERAVMQNP
jgi:tetratricopeptide (TPR) repeat protein